MEKGFNFCIGATLTFIARIIKSVHFSKTRESDFTKELKSRINNYFKENNKHKQGDWSMHLKAYVMIALYLTPLIFILFNIITNPVWVIIFYVLSGLGMAFMGMGVMHDANHGSLSKRSSVNAIFSRTLDFVGCSSAVWKLQHNVLHHTYTNIDELDEDIHTPFFLSFTPHTKKYWIHRFQHLYAWFFYGLTTMHWITSKDFLALHKYYKLKLIPTKRAYRIEILKTIAWKTFYYSYALVLPMIFNESGWLVILLGFLSMHFVTGLFIAVIFQLAHVMPDMRFPEVEAENKVDSNWYVHQLETTSNFSPNSRIFSWFIGGLNYQIEHHLFPHISHKHYRKLSKIISKTAQDFGLPYHVNKNFILAVWRHLKMLRKLGNMQNAYVIK